HDRVRKLTNLFTFNRLTDGIPHLRNPFAVILTGFHQAPFSVFFRPEIEPNRSVTGFPPGINWNGRIAAKLKRERVTKRAAPEAVIETILNRHTEIAKALGEKGGDLIFRVFGELDTYRD